MYFTFFIFFVKIYSKPAHRHLLHESGQNIGGKDFHCARPSAHKDKDRQTG